MARIMMLCHDQHLDRRVLAQATSLLENGHNVRLLALSFDAESQHETLSDGLELTRIGLRHIIPENPTYIHYNIRQHKLNACLNRACNRYPQCAAVFQSLFQYASRLNWNLYKALLLMRYHNRTLHDPLPFRQAFVEHGREYPCDLIQVHDLPALQAGAELAAERNVPLVYDAHELYPEQASFSRVQRKLCSAAEAHWIQKADLVFAVNQSIGQEMARRYRIADPVTLLNAIAPPSEFDPEVRYDLLREKLDIPSTRRILLFQGGFAPHRNLEQLVAAMPHVKTADVDLVMMGPGDFAEKLKQKAASAGLLDKRIYFLPAVPQSELLQHSASADIGIIPYPHIDLNSLYCTPNKLFEFIAAGLPILANDSPELNRFVCEQGFGMTQRMNNPKAIAAAIDGAFAAPEYPAWSKNLCEKRHAFAWDVQKTGYVQHMNALLAK